MAIQSNYNASSDSIVFKKVAQPPPFRATQKGLNVTHPNFPATEHNSNALLYQTLAKPPAGKPYLSNMWLFVSNIQTGWNLSGNTTQAQTSRNFYPNYLTQNDLTISGTMANQHEYDKLVEMVEYHQNYLFTFANQDQAGILDVGGIQIPAIYFTMYKPNTRHAFNFVEGFSVGNDKNVPQGVNVASGNNTIAYALVITQMQAGHEQFVFAPAFTLTCKVVDDFRQSNSDTAFNIQGALNYQTIFGDFTNPVGVISNPPGPTTSDAPTSTQIQHDFSGTPSESSVSGSSTVGSPFDHRGLFGGK